MAYYMYMQEQIGKGWKHLSHKWRLISDWKLGLFLQCQSKQMLSYHLPANCSLLWVVLLSSQSSDSTKSLKLPVDYSVLKAVVDYIYTDEAPDGLGECCRFLICLYKAIAAAAWAT